MFASGTISHFYYTLSVLVKFLRQFLSNLRTSSGRKGNMGHRFEIRGALNPALKIAELLGYRTLIELWVWDDPVNQGFCLDIKLGCGLGLHL